MAQGFWSAVGVISAACLAGASGAAWAADDFPPFAKVSEGYERVVAPGGQGEFYALWTREKDAQVLAELPKDYEGKRFYLVATVAAGHPQVGVYSIWHDAVGVRTKAVEWRRRGDHLALVEPNMAVRSSGDDQSRAGVTRVNTDRVVLAVPILATGPGGGPVIDLDRALLGSSDEFVGSFLRGASTALARITRAKVFPRNIELGFELPRAGGQLAEVRFSLGMPERSPGFEPRAADRRVGIYFESHHDRAINDGDSQVVRHANRWHIEKADPRLAMSPPKRPIVYHIEHTTPVRYRRWVREGVLAWNKAFERVGIVGAIEVRQQDAATGAYMDIDPEDIRHSFVRWTNAGMGFAIGPVNAHPDTGEIYEADIVMDEGFIGSYASLYLDTELAASAMSVVHPGLSGWLAEHPEWDPRVRLAAPGDRGRVSALTRALAERPDAAGELLADAPPTMSPFVWAGHRPGGAGGAHRMCMMQPGMSSGVAAARLAMDLGLGGLAPEAGSDDASLLDGLPESFVGPLLREVVMHEVGHTLGLMHNWKGSALHSVSEMNAEGFDRPIQSTVMDYAATNIVVDDAERGFRQGAYVPNDIGEYDKWAIEWNYTFGDPAEVAARAAEPAHAFMAEDGQFSPDPHAKTWDLGRDTIEFAEERMRFVRKARADLLTRGVRDGQSWQKARQVHQQLLGMQQSAVSTAIHWIGGAHVHRSMKGDEGAPAPVRPVDVAQQRRALRFVVEHAFDAASFGLDPEVLAHLQSDNWYDEGYAAGHAWPVTQSVLGVQASAMTGLINPQRLAWVMDNELRTPAGEDALTVPEILAAVRERVWSAPDAAGPFTEREPMIGQLGRNLQNEHLSRMVSLATGMRWPGASGRTIQALAREELRAIRALLPAEDALSGVDAYSTAHLRDVRERIDRALEAAYLRTE